MSAELSVNRGFPGVPEFEIWDRDLRSTDPLTFAGYQVPAGEHESVCAGLITAGATELVLIACTFAHHGGTMGVVAGERIVRAFDRATERGLPVALVISTGGARLQEGMIALTQMGRAAAAVARHRAAGLMTAAVLRAPTTGGVYASWGSLAEVTAGEPGATIGFGGPRVVAQVTGSFPPPDSHTAESAFRNGNLDALVGPGEQWDWLLGALFGPGPALVLPPGRPDSVDSSPIPADGWQLLTRSRDARRPSGLEWAAWLTDGWVELRGSDPTIRAGLASIGGRRTVVVAMDRHALSVGADRHAVGDGAARPGPAAFRLAQRAIATAQRLGLPVLSLIDTPGAEPGPVAEADGVAGEIARTVLAMAAASVPTVALCVGEGGSGGAVALAHADRFLMLSGSVFSVIGPEAGAAILFRDATRAPELARALRITPAELLSLGVIDAVVDETDADAVAAVRTAVCLALDTAIVGDREVRADRLARRYLSGG